MTTPTQAQAVLTIDGMGCGSCAEKIETLLSKVDGVLAARVAFAEKQAHVTYDPATLSPDRIAAAIEAGGYDAKPVGA